MKNGQTTISLITLQYINNYGSVLQTFASQAYLEAKGCSVEVVNYTRENCRFENLKKSMKSYYRSKGPIFRLPLVSDLLVMRWQRLYWQRNRVFEQFRNDYICLSEEYASAQDLFENPPAADAYCVGSDQVWNYLYNDGVLPEYFLRYAPNGKRKFALSSSIGVEEIADAACGALIKEYLEDFCLVTVREDSAKWILDELGVSNCHQILDPTLLVSKEDWISRLNLQKPTHDRYVLVYQLNPCREMDDFAAGIAKSKGCKLIVISNNIRLSIPGAEIISNPAVECFLSLVLHAECIVTDSFHGTAFSINFNKEFFSWLPGKYNTRLTSVLELTGLAERAFTVNDDRWERIQPINYSQINKILEKHRDQAGDLIEEALANNEEQ